MCFRVMRPLFSVTEESFRSFFSMSLKGGNGTRLVFRCKTITQEEEGEKLSDD